MTIHRILWVRWAGLGYRGQQRPDLTLQSLYDAMPGAHGRNVGVSHVFCLKMAALVAAVVCVEACAPAALDAKSRPSYASAQMLRPGSDRRLVRRGPRGQRTSPLLCCCLGLAPGHTLCPTHAHVDCRQSLGPCMHTHARSTHTNANMHAPLNT